MSLVYLIVLFCLGSFETIATLKSSLLEALTAVLTSNAEIGELIQGLDGAIARLESTSSTQTGKQESLVKIAFDYLLKFKALQISSATEKTSVGSRHPLTLKNKLTVWS